MRAGPLVARWIGAAFLSLGFVWGFSSLLMDTPLVYVWSAELSRYVVAEGEQRHVSEGIATTRTGKYGVNGIPDITRIETPIVALWGDSHVDARQVADDEKMAQAFTRIWNSRSRNPLTGIGIGMGGWSMADIYFHLPTYEKLLPNLRCHCIVLTDIEDFRPDLKQRECWLSSQPTLHFEPSKWAPPYEEFKAQLILLRANFVWWLLKDIRENVRLQFQPGPRHRAAPTDDGDAARLPTDAWEFVVNALRDRATRPIFFLYLPRAPGLQDGKLRTEFADSEAGREFAALCAKAQVSFVDLGPRLIEFARQERRFPRGFPSTFVWHGHLNVDGHRLVAEALADFLEKTPSVIQSN
ncbi:MAG: hypothetical protein ACKVX7_07695 [Planctomycetota bacterium]